MSVVEDTFIVPVRIVLVDDEPLARDELRELLRGLEAVEIVGEAASVAEARRICTEQAPDVVLLDIQLRGESGFDLVPHVPPETAIVFVTAFDKYAIRAFEVNARDYVLKPVEPERLVQSLARVRQRQGATAEASSTEPKLITRLTYNDLWFADDAQQSRFIRVQDITHITADGNYSVVHVDPAGTSGRRDLLLNQTLTAWEARLPTDHFVRIHRSAIVNMAYVERVSRGTGYVYHVFLRNRMAPLAMSRRRAKVLKSKLG